MVVKADAAGCAIINYDSARGGKALAAALSSAAPADVPAIEEEVSVPESTVVVLSAQQEAHIAETALKDADRDEALGEDNG
jgi:hypothetical protein